MARPQVPFRLGRQQLAPRAQPIDAFATPAVPLPEGAVSNEWLEAAKAIAPLTQSVSEFLQGVEKSRRQEAPDEAQKLISGFNGDLSFLKDMPTMSTEDAAAYLEKNQEQFPTLKQEYAARPDFLLYAQALAGSRYIKEEPTIEGPSGDLITVSEALSLRLEEAMQPGVDSTAIRKEVREQFLESIGSPQSEAWTMALMDGLTPLEAVWDERVRQGKAQNVVWKADQDFKSNMSEALHALTVHQAHPPTAQDVPESESPAAAKLRAQQDAASREAHEAETERLGSMVKTLYEAAGKVGDRKRNSNFTSALEQVLREISEDDEDGLELAEALEGLRESEYADGKTIASSGVFSEALAKIELELIRERQARKASRKEDGPTDTQVMDIAVHDILMEQLRSREPKTPEEARQSAEGARAELEELFERHGLSKGLVSKAMDDASNYYTRVYTGEPRPETPEATELSDRISRLIDLGQLNEAEAMLRGSDETLGSSTKPLLDKLEEAKGEFREQGYVTRQIDVLKQTVIPEDTRKMLRPSALGEVSDMDLEMTLAYEEAILELPMTEREGHAVQIRKKIQEEFQPRALELVENANIANNPDQIVDFPEFEELLESSAKLLLDIQGTPVDDDGDGQPDRFRLTLQDQVAIDNQKTVLRAAGVAQAAQLVEMDWGSISVQERIQAIRRTLIQGDPGRQIGGYGTWMQKAITPKETRTAPGNLPQSQLLIEGKPPQSPTYEGVNSWFRPVMETFSDLRDENRVLASEAIVDLLGTTTGHLGTDKGFFDPTSRGMPEGSEDWSNPEIRERLSNTFPLFAEGLQRYQQYYPSVGRTTRMYLSGFMNGHKPSEKSLQIDQGFTEIGKGLAPIFGTGTENILPYLREAVAATGLTFKEVAAGRLAETNVTLRRLFGSDGVIASGAHIGPFSPKAFDKAVAEFEDPASREGSQYYQAFKQLGVAVDEQMIGTDPSGTPYPEGMTQGDFLMGRIKARYNANYRGVLPESDLSALDIPFHEFGRLRTNVRPDLYPKATGGFPDLLNYESVEGLTPEAFDPTIHGPLIHGIYQTSKDFYTQPGD